MKKRRLNVKKKKKQANPEPRPGILVSLPDLQDQIRLVNRVSGTATEPELEVWEEIGQLLSDIYVELQGKREVILHRPHYRHNRQAKAARRAG